jgi:uncharacterized protein (TIGR02611 family)
MNQLRRQSKKVLVGVLGGLVVLLGLILVPYPGPGWLIVFGGLAILATEFAFAAKVLDYAKNKYDTWVAWLKRQNIIIKILVLACTTSIVIFTLWLFNAFGILNSLFDLERPWLMSPFLR